MKSLQQRIDSVFDYLYASSPVKNTEIMAHEFAKVLHTGIFIEQKKAVIPAFKNYFPQEKNSLFSTMKDVQFIRNCYSEMNQEWELYKNDDEIKFSDNDISFLCSEFCDLILSDKDNDLIGDSLEIFRNYSIKSLGGQFFTDTKVTNLALDILGYSALNEETFIDICSGTGGFLLAAINKIKKELKEKNINEKSSFPNLVVDHVFGKEIDETVRKAANRNIQTRIGTNTECVSAANSLILDSSEFNKYDCIATNPPFGTKTTIVDSSVLENFELACKNGSKIPTPTPPDILFLEQNIKLLKNGSGKMAIVLPYQILSGPKTNYIRTWLLRHCKILAVIDLPAETFQPHTGTKTSLLVVQKYEQPLTDFQNINYDIFMAKPKWVGHDRRGLPIYKKNLDGSNSTDILCDFNLVYNDWKIFLSNSKKIENPSICQIVNAQKVLQDESYRLNALVYVDENANTKSGIELQNLVSDIFYPGRFKRNYVKFENNAVPFLGGANITEHIVSTKKFISKDDPHYKQLMVKEGWILITRSGTTGIVSIVPKAWDGFAISEHVIRIIPDESKENPNFIYAFLQSDNAKKQLEKQVFGSVIDEISPDAVGKLIVPQLPQEEKNKISDSIASYKRLTNESISCYRNAQLLLKKII